MTASVSDFFAAVAASSLLTAEQLSELKLFAEKCTDVDRLVKHLVEQKLLTSWQAKMLMRGQTRFFLGRYKLLSLLGQGGMGAVFLAEQTPLARIVAVKTMNAQATSTPDAVARFQREIRAAAALDHPNIVRAIDADSANGSHFLVMEYVDGRDLSAVVKESGAMEIADACDCIRQAAIGLQHAHERNMVHRDIKPGNLLLTSTDAGLPLVRILDMGLARFTSETTEAGDLTATGQVMGSIDYISPEQSKDSHRADIRSDIFSLGCTLYFLLTGTAPYPGRNSVQRVMARVMSEAPRVRYARPEIPLGLDDLLARMLEREPADRIQTPAELADALGPFCIAAGAAAVPMAKPVRTGDATTKLNGLATAAPSHTDAATVIVSSDRLKGEPESVNSELQNFLNLLTAEARSDNGLANVDPPPVVAAPIAPIPVDSAVPVSSTASIRNRRQGERRIVYAVAALCVIAIVVVVFLAKQQSANATHVDLSLSASERNDLDLRIDGRKVAIPSSSSASFTGSPGERTVFARRPGFVPIELTLNLKPGETKKVELLWKKAVDTSLAINRLRSQMGKLVSTTNSWPPSGANATVGKLRSELIQNLNFTLNADEHRETADMLRALPGPFDEFPRVTMPVDPPLDESVPLVGVLGAISPRLRHWGQVNSLAFSPDGTRLYSAGAGVVKCWSLEDGRLLSWRNCGHGEARISVSPDGRFLTVTDGPILILDADDLGILAGEIPVDSGQFQIAFSRDSQHIAAAFTNGTVTLWTVHGVKVWSQPNLHAGRIDGINFSSDSRILATGDVEGGVRVWDASTGELQHTLDGHDQRITALSFFDSNTKLLVSTQNGPLSTWDLNSEPPARTDSDDHFMRARISRDGRLLATQFADQLALADRETGQEIHRFHCAANQHCDVAFSDDGKRIAFSVFDHTIKVFDCVTGEPVVPQPDQPRSTDCFALSPDDSRLHAAFAGSEWRHWTIDSGEAAEAEVEPPRFQVRTMQFHPNGKQLVRTGAFNFVDWQSQTIGLMSHETYIGCWAMPAISFNRRGSRFAVAGTDNCIRVLDPTTDEIVFTTEPQSAGAYAIALTPDGTRLVCIDETHWVHVWDVKSREKIRTKRSFNGPPLDVDVTTNGHHFIAGAGVLGVYNLTTLDPDFTLPLEHTRSVSVSPDGRLLAQVDKLGRLHVVDLESQSIVRKFQLGPPYGMINQVEFASDSRHVLAANGNGSIYILRLADPETPTSK